MIEVRDKEFNLLGVCLPCHPPARTIIQGMPFRFMKKQTHYVSTKEQMYENTLATETFIVLCLFIEHRYEGNRKRRMLFYVVDCLQDAQHLPNFFEVPQ